MRLIMFMTFAKLIPLVLLIIVGVTHISGKNLQWQNSLTLNDIGSGTLILFFAFLGIETAVTNSGEFKNPSRVVPWGILSGLLIGLLVYVSIQLVSQGILGNELLSYKEAPLAEVAGRIFGFAGITMIIIGTAVSMLGGLSGAILAIPRVLYAGARDGILPKFLGRVHPKFITPHFAIIVYASLGYLFAVFGAFKQLVVLTTASTLLIYLGVVLATMKLRNEKKYDSEKTFKIPGGMIVPLLATAIIIWVLSHLSKAEMIGISIMLVILSLVYILVRRYKKEQVRMLAVKGAVIKEL
jgi:amino acid transporter